MDNPNNGNNTPDESLDLPELGASKPDVFIVQDDSGKLHYHLRVKSNDTVLELRRIPLMRYQMWLIAYQQTMPRPPLVEMRVAGRNVPQHDPTDSYYQLQQEAWNQRFEVEQQAYFFKQGVKSNPPEGFTTDYKSLGLDETNEDDKRFAWVSGLLETGQDITDVLTAIMHLFMPDENSIWEVQDAYFKSVREWQARKSIPAESKGREHDKL